jgi:hypothetical protein
MGNQLIPHPPPIASLGITHSVKLRFITNTAVNQTAITFQNLLDLINVALTTVTASQLFVRVRVRAVEMWATPVLGAATTVQVEFVGSAAGDQGDGRIATDTSMGIEPAHVRTRPAPRSGVALFQGTSTNTAFTLTCPSGTVVDVELSFRGLPGIFTATQNAPVGAVAGAWYYRGLDGLALGATVFVPVVNGSGAD